ncbi:Shugoshin-1 [Apostasia shenzhenica]|uniref:Shugoshin-1 n=1 Tax=Apostasia shenzhenica TaxID=1088818 RepID=A0A2I0AB55_9ASPA|nr:Shugoshin-1 [Apostasia shenzhenica]
MRKRLSDVTNLCTNVAAERLVLSFEGNGNDESRMIAEGYIAKILKENNALKRALVERNKVIETTDAELKKLRLMLTKTNQQNWQIAQSHSNMLAELNLAKNRLISAEHELACSSAALRIKTLEVEEQKKFSKLNKPQHKISSKQLINCYLPIMIRQMIRMKLEGNFCGENLLAHKLKLPNEVRFYSSKKTQNF